MNDNAKVLVLRTCNADMTSHGGFKWPDKGEVTCPDWDSEPVCGNGLHGLPWGKGNWSLLSSDRDAIWQVVEVDTCGLVDIGGEKSKFRSGKVIFSGAMAQAVTMVLCHPDAMQGADNISSGDYSTAASSGDGSTAASSGALSTAASSGARSTAASSGARSTAASSGARSTAASSGARSTAASSGARSTAASSGDGSTAASSGALSTAASSGDGSTAASSGARSTAASSGAYSTAESKGKDTIAMAAGISCVVSAGENGCFASAWYDETANRNRIKVGYVGQRGIKADTPYRLDSAGKWVEA
jgi:hypothetical protein